MALLLHIDWWGEILPLTVLGAIILAFGTAAGRVGKKTGRWDGAGSRAARADGKHRRGRLWSVEMPLALNP